MADFDKTINTVTVIDFETASAGYYSACSIGLVVLEGDQIIDKQYRLIQPPDNYYAKDNIAVHGITPDMTAANDTFPAVWEKVKGYFANTFVAAHNAGFDMSVLKTTLDYYGVEQPDFLYIDTIKVSGKFMRTGERGERSLDARCAYFGIPLASHHNALCDAEAAAGLIQYAMRHQRYKTIGTFLAMYGIPNYQYAEVKIKKSAQIGGFGKKINVNEVAAATTVGAPDADFYGKVFVFTGELSRMTREQAMAKVIACGGSVKNSMSNKVDVLVNADGRMSGKVKAALEMQAAGHHIKIATEEQFMAMLADDGAIDF